DQTQENSTTYVSEDQNQKLKSAHLECHQRMLTISSKTALSECSNKKMRRKKKED
ncbi:hypothetical protein BgiMline_019235, partial [Biomphalaria glabrata]